jgi:hypothetical protein
MRPTPLTQDGLLGLFKGEAVGRNVKLIPASQEDMRGGVVGREAVARSRLRRGLTGGFMNARSRPQPATVDGAACHGGAAEMRRAADAAGKSEVLAQYAADYPAGPHDQPQSMCPAFGSLRVGLRMRRTATVLSGSACCVYGLTFTSHFYGARRSVGYVPFNSETLVTGKLFEDIREAVFKLADPANYDAIVVTSLCVPTASGVPLQLLPKEINGVRIIGIDVPGFGVPTHAEAKDVLAGAMLSYARNEAEQGPVAAPRGGLSDRPTVTLLGEMFPADPVSIGRCSSRSALPPDRSCRPANGASSTRRSTAPSSPPSIRSTPPRSVSSRRPAGRSSARRRSARRHRGLAGGRSVRPAGSRGR